MYSRFLFISYFIFIFSLGKAADKIATSEDRIYEDNIKTVLLYPKLGGERDVIQSPVLSIEQTYPLVLMFDELYKEYQNYYFKLIHCNADWSPSVLLSMEYMNEINEFLITNYTLSTSTKVPYVHYQAEMPKVRLAGNYIVKVYRSRDENDVVLTKRFMIYDNRVQINHKITFSNVLSEMKKNQQIDFSISYSNYDVLNPQQNIKVTLRQNQRWDNAIVCLPPLFTREDQKLLEYNYFDLKNNFKGGNEFRSFDIRTINFSGFNVEKVNPKASISEIYLFIDKPKTNQSYSWMVDMNGKFVVDNYDLQGTTTIGSDYVWVHFFLATNSFDKKSVYVAGAFSDWKLNDDYKMLYDVARNSYFNKVLLKQGWYNYTYLLKNNDGPIDYSLIDGSYVDTENQYEIFVYARPVGARADVLVGYVTTQYNARN